MSNLRFDVGAAVLCNLGPAGWKLGRVIALHYREAQWPAQKTAPYQVALEDDHTLIYVPEDDDRCCRAASPEDLRIARRLDALAALPSNSNEAEPEPIATDAGLGCTGDEVRPGSAGYRGGRCHGCERCPPNWSAVELYSEHYRCAARNGLRVTRRRVDLGTVRVGEALHHPADEASPSRGGFLQCPTLVRLPPGVRFSDDGALNGAIRFDPHRDATYRVEFVAVSTVAWDDAEVGIIRLKISFVVEGNEPPNGFDVDAFVHEQQQARSTAKLIVRDLINTWLEWEQGQRDNRDTCDQMRVDLHRLRTLLERHPRLDGGRWWVQLGGFHMNVHKLLENTLFECELYLGHALTFGDAEVRRQAEQNLKGCYQKRLLEAARFLWIDGVEQMMRGQWATAADTLHRAAAQQDGWGWAVNYGDIWLSESAARIVHGAELTTRDGDRDREGARWIAEAARLLEKAVARVHDAGVFGTDGHPWASEIQAALDAYHDLQASGTDATEWLKTFKSRTLYWCAQVLGGAAPFPPQPKPRLEDAAALVQRLPGQNG
ncbi:MAG: hypothetical protein AAFQ65_01710 [Myxococcota bacterium]